MATNRKHREGAMLIRLASGTTDIEKTLHKVTRILSENDIPHLVVGGYAVQEHGYARFTADVDIIVPNVQYARERLSISGFRENRGSSMTVTDRVTHVEVDLMPGGGAVGPGPLKLPMPWKSSSEPNIASLSLLIEIKLSSYIGSPGSRIKDAADVVELIKANNLPRDFELSGVVCPAYETLWDALKKESVRAGIAGGE